VITVFAAVAVGVMDPNDFDDRKRAGSGNQTVENELRGRKAGNKGGKAGGSRENAKEMKNV
jgi:hypothetical protein